MADKGKGQGPSWLSGGGSSSGGGGSGPSWLAGGSGSPAPSQHHGGGGVLGRIEGGAHWVAQKAGLAAHDVKAIPGGIYDIVNTEQHLLRKTIAHPLADPNDPRYGVNQGKWGKHASELVHGMEQGVVTSVEHPLRDPFQTITTVLPLLSGAGSVAARAGAVGRAAGEGATVGDLARAAVATPEPQPRLVRVGDAQVPLHPSSNPAVRAAQGLHDRIIQHAIDTNPEGRVASYGTKRVEGSLAETARYQQRLRDVPSQLLQKAARRLAPTGGRLPGTAANRFQRVEQAALELTSVNTTPRLAAAYHLLQARKGIEPEMNRAVAKLYKTVDQRGLLTTNDHGDVIVNAADHPQLAHADVQLARVQGRGDEILARYGVRTPEQLQAAVDAPGRYRAGATYERPTPAKAGQSPSLDRAVRQRDNLQRQFDLANEKQRGRLVDRPMTVDEARHEHARLQLAHDQDVTRIASEMFGPVDKREVAYRNAQNARARRQANGNRGAAAWKSTVRPTVKEEQRRHVEAMIEDQIAKNGDHPTVKRWADRAARLDQLKAALEPEMFDRLLPTKQVFVPRSGKLERIGGALSVANDRVQRLERMLHGYTDEKGVHHPGTVKETGIVGGEQARPGRGHVSYAGTEPKAPKSAAASAASPVVGEARAPITSHANEGINISKGRVPNDVTGQASRHLRQIVRFVNTTEHRNQAIRTGSTMRQTSRDVLVKVPGAEHAKIPAAVNEILGKTKVTHDDVAGINAALNAYREDMVPGLRDRFAGDKQQGIGTPAPEGYRWVDRNILGDLAKPAAGPRGRIARTADTINAAVTAATVYFKIGHVGTRILTNASTNILQGSARPLEIAKSVEMWKSLSHEDRLRALAAAGQHGFQSMPHEGQNLVGRAAGVGANWWAKHADAVFRFNSIAYEARKAGFDTPEKFHDLLNRLESPHDHNMNAAESAKVDWVAKRANRESIAYDRLSESERRYLTRAVWFYPWLRGTVGFAGNTLIEHPFKSAVLAKEGEHGRQLQEQQLGTLPSYEGGLLKLGGPADRPLVADFSTFSPFATPADIADAVARPAELSGFLNPAAAAGTNLIFGLDQYGGKSTSPLRDAAASLASPTPEAQIITAFLQRHQPQGRRMFPKSPDLWGTRDPLIRALVGPGTPRRLNTSAAHRAYGRELSGR